MIGDFLYKDFHKKYFLYTECHQNANEFLTATLRPISVCEWRLRKM